MLRTMQHSNLQLPDNYYHCFLGNGTDAVLVGYTGSMVPDKVVVDRCNWFKSNRYYPEDKLVMVAGRYPLDKTLEHAEGSGWYEIAPLGRTWYYLLDDQGQPLEITASEQNFVPQEGTLYSKVEYGNVKGEVVTWLHATKSILIERYTFDQDVNFQAWIGAGSWDDNDVWDTNPMNSVQMSDTAPEGQYDAGESKGFLALRMEPTPSEFGSEGDNRWVSLRGRTFTKYFMISDNQQGNVNPALIDEAIAEGYDGLRESHLSFWSDFFAASSIHIPEPQFQYFYDASMYHFKAAQSVVSGGLPVNNLRRTWSSHIFWDAFYIHRAILGANHRYEALEACRFFQRTLDHAKRHASEEFGAPGLKWDWEITHDGRKAYGTLLHMRFQVHNNGSYSNMIMGYYLQTQDKAFLEEFYPILEGLAQFFMNEIVEKTEDGYEIGLLVGVHESAIKVRNDGTNLAATIALLNNCAAAAEILGRETDFTRECKTVAVSLMETMGRLFNGSYFKASDDEDRINMSSIAPIYPLGVISPTDERAISTANAYINRYEGQMIGHGNSNSGFPWSSGVLGTILAWQKRSDLVWKAITDTRATLSNFGGMTEVMEDGEWNMQYFGTAEAAVATAIQQMLLQCLDHETIDLFPAIPEDWDSTGFRDLLSSGLTVTSEWTPNSVEWNVQNVSDQTLTRQIRYQDKVEAVTLQPGESRGGTWQF
jgi:hypothetical protein